MKALFGCFSILTISSLFIACGNDAPAIGTGGGASGGATSSGGVEGGLGGEGGAAPLPALIDDLEDGDETIALVEGRTGAWRTVGDDTVPMKIAVEKDGTSASLAMHVTSDAHSEWGGGVALGFLADLPASGYDASKYAGVRFKARAANSTVLRVSVPDANTDQGGGVCSSCWDHFATEASVGTEWRDYVLDFTKLAQQGFGEPQPGLEKTKLFGLQFHTGAGAAIDFWIDDVVFLLPGEEKPVIEEPPPRVVPDETPIEMHGKLSVSGTKIVDEHGKPFQLKGISTMWLNWETDGYGRSAKSLEWLRDQWGVSVIRAAMGVEPAGAYIDDPDSAKAEVEKVVEAAIAAGIYVIIDFHDHNAHLHTEAAKAFFAEMAEKYKGVPNVLYETFNEPLAVNWSAVLKPYHESVVAEIRAKDSDALIILGTPNWSQDVDAAALDPLTGANLLYTLHFYACTHTSWLRAKADEALDADLPLFVSEWGATGADGGLNGAVCEIQAEEWTDWMKEKSIGFAAWKFDGCTDSSCILAIGAPVNGPFLTKDLQGHGYFVRAKIMEE